MLSDYWPNFLRNGQNHLFVLILNFVFICFHWFQFWKLPEYYSLDNWSEANKKALIIILPILHSQLLTPKLSKPYLNYPKLICICMSTLTKNSSSENSSVSLAWSFLEMDTGDNPRIVNIRALTKTVVCQHNSLVF
jgi:hypothetical protein